MRNRNVGPDWSADILAQVVASTTYKPTWTFSLGEISRGQGCEGLTLVIEASVPDSFAPNEIIRFAHLFPVLPAAYDERAWQKWVYDCIEMTESHERMEYFRVAGRQVFFPDHGPGRNPYEVCRVKTEEQAYEAATPWHGGPPKDPYFEV